MNLESAIAAANSYLTARVEKISYAPAETWVLAAALAVAFLSGSRLWRIARREEAQRQRLAALRGAPADAAGTARAQRLPWYRQLGSLIAASAIIGTVEQQRLLKLLAAAGLRGQGSLATFVATKFCGAVALGGLVWLTIELRHWFAGAGILRIALLIGAFMLGWRLPDIILSRLAARRRLRIEQGIPDALDLLVISAEAGLSLNQAIEEVSRDIRPSNREVSEEFDATAAEMRVLPDVGQALDNLAERTGIENLRSIIATLKQSMKFGTPLAESMRILAAEMRAAHLARIEERAARLPVLLAIPMMVFILPCVLMVVGTPVALRVADTLGSFISGLH
jgi:tight adherence protein C